MSEMRQKPGNILILSNDRDSYAGSLKLMKAVQCKMRGRRCLMLTIVVILVSKRRE